jgi:uncharacterized membrane protein
MNVLRNLLLPQAALGRRFPAHALTAIEETIAKSELTHTGEIRFAIETALDLGDLWRFSSARERALEVFGELRVWDTQQRNGVLIYVLLAERDVEIVADRSLDGRVTDAEWRRVCELMEQEFRAQRWRNGAIAGIEATTALLAREFPATDAPNPNEQPNRPAVL